MKKLNSLLTLFILSLLYSCGVKNDGADLAIVDDAEQLPTTTSKPAVCLWKEIAIRDSPSEKGKYTTSIYLGEKLTALADTASDVAGSKKALYRKVELIDGTQGWVREDFIAVDGVPAAFLREATIYKRPDIMTTSGKNFNKMDFVAIKGSTDGGWTEVIGKRTGDTWFTSGWVKSENLTNQEVDVAFSVFYVKAMEITDEAKRSEEIRKILDNGDLSTSVFQAALVSNENAVAEELNAEGTTEQDNSDESIQN